MSRRALRALVGAAFVVLYGLHNDLWLWHRADLSLGLPVGLSYHIAYCLATAALLAVAARFTWPSHLERLADSGEGTGDDKA